MLLSMTVDFNRSRYWGYDEDRLLSEFVLCPANRMTDIHV